jgi:hypothetical protein
LDKITTVLLEEYSEYREGMETFRKAGEMEMYKNYDYRSAAVMDIATKLDIPLFDLWRNKE